MNEDEGSVKLKTIMSLVWFPPTSPSHRDPLTLTIKHTQSCTHITQRFVLGLDAPARGGEARSGSAARFVFGDGQQGAT